MSEQTKSDDAEREPPVMPDDAEMWRSALVSIHVGAQIIRQWDLGGMVQASERAQTTVPILDPTLWIKKHKAADYDLRVLRAALALINAIDRKG